MSTFHGRPTYNMTFVMRSAKKRQASVESSVAVQNNRHLAITMAANSSGSQPVPFGGDVTYRQNQTTGINQKELVCYNDVEVGQLETAGHISSFSVELNNAYLGNFIKKFQMNTSQRRSNLSVGKFMSNSRTRQAASTRTRDSIRLVQTQFPVQILRL